MLPDDYVGLVVTDTRRARQWEAGLRRSGFDVVCVETSGADAAKGDWQIGVPSAQKSDARAFVSQVVRGDRELPSPPMLSRSGWFALAAIGFVVAALVLGGLLSR